MNNELQSAYLALGRVSVERDYLQRKFDEAMVTLDTCQKEFNDLYESFKLVAAQVDSRDEQINSLIAENARINEWNRDALVMIESLTVTIDEMNGKDDWPESLPIGDPEMVTEAEISAAKRMLGIDEDYTDDDICNDPQNGMMGETS